MIGAGHLEGVANHLRENREPDKQRMRDLNFIAPPNPAWKVVKWGIPVLMLGLFGWFASQGDMEALKDAAQLGWHSMLHWPRWVLSSPVDTL